LNAFPAKSRDPTGTPAGWFVRAGRLAVVVSAFLLPAAPASAFVFNEPTVRQIGPETVPFDWSAHKCNDNDIPDQPARAFREANGTINFVDTHHTAWRSTTTNLTTLSHRCSPVMMNSGNNTDPSMYDDKEWIAAPWTSDGTTVYAVIHMEYQGWRHAPGGYCIRSGEPSTDRLKCWQNALTLATSTNGGSTFSHTTPPSHLVAGSPTRYVQGNGPLGFFQPSHVVKGQDGWHYMIARVMGGSSPQPAGSCVLRTRNVADPTSWRGWSGTGFTVTFPSPYLNTLDPAEHICQPTANTGTLSESLGWSTYFKKWILVGSADNADGVSGPGFYFLTSDDLVNWSAGGLLMKAELPWTWQCSDGPQYYRDPSLLDPQSKTRNFDTMGQRPYLFFTRFNINSCTQSLDRDLIRIPIEFSNQAPGGPAAALAASSPARTGEPVTFDASASRDADGSITKYEWDLDGDGSYERDSGTEPVVTHSYEKPGALTVTVRVHDDDGKATDETTEVDVSPGAGEAEPPGGGGPVGRTSAVAVGKALGRFRVVRSRARDGGAAVRVRVPAAGVLRGRAARGAPAIRPVRVNAAREGILTVTVRASRAGAAALARRGSRRTRARFSFTPVGGATQTAIRSLRLARG
jgi:PKD domain